MLLEFSLDYLTVQLVMKIYIVKTKIKKQQKIHVIYVEKKVIKQLIVMHFDFI